MNAPAEFAPRPDCEYRVLRYYTGDFIGRCVAVTRTTAVMVITDTLRPAPKVIDRCAFPGCVRGDFHAGDHEFSRVRPGAEITVSLGIARFVPIGERQAAA